MVFRCRPRKVNRLVGRVCSRRSRRRVHGAGASEGARRPPRRSRACTARDCYRGRGRSPLENRPTPRTAARKLAMTRRPSASKRDSPREDSTRVGGFAGIDGDAAVPGPLRRRKGRVPTRRGPHTRIQLVFEGAHFLDADDVGARDLQELEKPLAGTGPQSIDIPAHDAHGARVRALWHPYHTHESAPHRHRSTTTGTSPNRPGTDRTCRCAGRLPGAGNNVPEMEHPLGRRLPALAVRRPHRRSVRNRRRPAARHHRGPAERPAPAGGPRAVHGDCRTRHRRTGGRRAPEYW